MLLLLWAGTRVRGVLWACGTALELRSSSLCGVARTGCRNFGACCRHATARAAPVDRASALQLLGLDSSSTPGPAEIKRAFKRKVVLLHPDRGTGNEKQFQVVVAAYGALTGQRRYADDSSVGGKRRGSRVESEEERHRRREARFKEDGMWRWDQEKGFNPSDLDEVWAEIGYNPYTGEYIKQKSAPAASGTYTGVAPGMGDFYAAYRDKGSQGASARDPDPSTKAETEMSFATILQLVGYVCLVALCIMRALELGSVQQLLAAPPTQ